MARRRPATIARVVQPKPLPGEVPWVPPFQYECSNGHEIGTDRAICGCPMCIDGQPCGGTLRRFGAGSKGPRS